jgi:hypothetical protein
MLAPFVAGHGRNAIPMDVGCGDADAKTLHRIRAIDIADGILKMPKWCCRKWHSQVAVLRANRRTALAFKANRTVPPPLRDPDYTARTFHFTLYITDLTELS